MRRELAIALRARVTWLAAAVAALLTGHGLVLAVDLYTQASRSALASALETREMDPLLGVVRPTLGGAELAVALLGPVVAARVLAVEKERGSFAALALAEGSTDVVVLRKLVAAFLACSLVVVPAVLAVATFAAVGGHVDVLETGVALLGTALHVAVVTAVSIAAAAWTRTTAQAATIGVLVSISAWAVDASEGFAALAWLGGAAAFSIDRMLLPFGRAELALGPLLWLATLAAGAFALAVVGARLDLARGRRRALGAVVVALVATALAREAGIRRAWDWTEARRSSLPANVVAALRALDAPVAVDVWLDRDDARRRQLEGDVLEKLVLARPDVRIGMPLDERPSALAARGEDYGRIVVHAGDGVRETRSTSRREIVTLVFEAAGVAAPEPAPIPYPGYPVVVEGARRTLVLALAYVVWPLAFVAIGVLVTRRRTSR